MAEPVEVRVGQVWEHPLSLDRWIVWKTDDWTTRLNHPNQRHPIVVATAALRNVYRLVSDSREQAGGGEP